MPWNPSNAVNNNIGQRSKCCTVVYTEHSRLACIAQVLMVSLSVHLWVSGSLQASSLCSLNLYL